MVIKLHASNKRGIPCYLSVLVKLVPALHQLLPLVCSAVHCCVGEVCGISGCGREGRCVHWYVGVCTGHPLSGGINVVRHPAGALPQSLTRQGNRILRAKPCGDFCSIFLGNNVVATYKFGGCYVVNCAGSPLWLVTQMLRFSFPHLHTGVVTALVSVTPGMDGWNPSLVRLYSMLTLRA